MAPEVGVGARGILIVILFPPADGVNGARVKCMFDPLETADGVEGARVKPALGPFAVRTVAERAKLLPNPDDGHERDCYWQIPVVVVPLHYLSVQWGRERRCLPDIVTWGFGSGARSCGDCVGK